MSKISGTKMFAIRMPNNIRADLERAATETGKEVTAMVLEAISLYLSQRDEPDEGSVFKVCTESRSGIDLSGRRRSSVLDSMKENG